MERKLFYSFIGYLLAAVLLYTLFDRFVIGPEFAQRERVNFMQQWLAVMILIFQIIYAQKAFRVLLIISLSLAALVYSISMVPILAMGPFFGIIAFVPAGGFVLLILLIQAFDKDGHRWDKIVCWIYCLTQFIMYEFGVFDMNSRHLPNKFNYAVTLVTALYFIISSLMRKRQNTQSS